MICCEKITNTSIIKKGKSINYKWDSSSNPILDSININISNHSTFDSSNNPILDSTNYKMYFTIKHLYPTLNHKGGTVQCGDRSRFKILRLSISSEGASKASLWINCTSINSRKSIVTHSIKDACQISLKISVLCNICVYTKKI